MLIAKGLSSKHYELHQDDGIIYMSALGCDTISANYSEADGQISISEYKEPDINSFIVFLVEILKNTTNTKVIIQSLPEKYAKVFLQYQIK